MAKRRRAGEPGSAAAEHRFVDTVQASPGDLEPFRLDVVAAEAMFQIAVSDGVETDPNISAAIQGHVADPMAAVTSAEAQMTQAALGAQSQRLLAMLRRELERGDCKKKPFRRVVGNVVYVLTRRRGMVSCSGNQVFWVFLTQIPRELPESHRQNPTDGHFDSTEPNGSKTVINRLATLKAKGLVRAVAQTANGSDKGYAITEDWAFVFEGWTDLPGPPENGPLPPRAAARIEGGPA